MKKSLIVGIVATVVAGVLGAMMVEGILKENGGLKNTTKKISKQFNKTVREIKKKTSRVSEIADLMKKQKKIDIKSLQKLFPNVTARTLRRDMDKLEKLGIVKQKGHTKDSLYILA